MGPGFFWIDDVSMKRVDRDTAVTEKPILGAEEAPVAAPGAIVQAQAVRCPVCGYRNMPEWKNCYGCGAALSGRVSLEMAGKCARAGIELISAISAPTSLAIEVAARCNITLCAFVRETRATIFTHPHRLLN